MSRLKAYVKRTILEAAKEYAYPKKRRTAESTLSAFRDYAHGTDTGTWSDLIYTKDVLAMFNKYRSEIPAVIAQFLDNAGMNISEKVNPRNSDVTFADMLIACAQRKPMTWEAFTNDDMNAYAASLAIRFACEELLHEVASDLGVEL